MASTNQSIFKDYNEGGNFAPITTYSTTSSEGDRQLSRDGVKRPNKLSALTVTTAVSTTVALGAAIGYLCFLWSDPNRLNNSHIWYRIVLDGWVTRSITLTAAVVRLCVSSQAIITTSMLASLMVEQNGIALFASAQLAAIRIGNNGPFGLLSALRGSVARNRCLSIIAASFFVLTLLLQLTSTVLISDLGRGVLTIPRESNHTLSALSLANMNQSTCLIDDCQIKYWLNSQQNFQTFAEYRDQHGTDGSDEEKVLRDTGTVLRAFLPFSNASARTSIKHFEGAATVLDSRVTCIRPKTHSAFAVALNGNEGWILNGTLTPATAPHGLVLSNLPAYTWDVNEVNVRAGALNKTDTIFNWTQVIPFAEDRGEWNIVQKVMMTGPALVSSMDPRFPEVASLSDSHFTNTNTQLSGLGMPCYVKGDPVPLMTGRAYVLLNVTVTTDMAIRLNSTNIHGSQGFLFTQNKTTDRLSINPKNEWLEFTIPTLPDWRVAATLCYDSIISVNANIAASAEKPTFEPALSSWSTSEQHLRTKDIQQQLDAVSLHYDDNGKRGILTLHTTPEQVQEQVFPLVTASRENGATVIQYPYQNFIKESLELSINSGTITCGTCNVSFTNDYPMFVSYGILGAQQRSLFQDVMRSTSDPALAWQALYTLIGRSVYYDLLSYFDIPDQPMIAWFREAQFPQASRGVTSVIVALCANFAITGVVTALFLAKTKYSRLGNNSWQILAQTRPSIPKGLEADMSVLDDGVVKKRLAGSGMRYDKVGLRSVQQGDEEKIILVTL